tara:strand:- start:205 stop:390 length:186 start_codon:yes stop_codon:yes gene_type:complete
MLFKSYSGKLVKINKQDYNNDRDYYKQILITKGYVVKESSNNTDEHILDVLKINFINNTSK